MEVARGGGRVAEGVVGRGGGVKRVGSGCLKDETKYF